MAIVSGRVPAVSSAPPTTTWRSVIWPPTSIPITTLSATSAVNTGGALAGLFVQALRLCQKAGLVKLGNVAIDGTKIMANASTRRSVPYEKLTEREQYW